MSVFFFQDELEKQPNLAFAFFLQKRVITIFIKNDMKCAKSNYDNFLNYQILDKSSTIVDFCRCLTSKAYTIVYEYNLV